MATLVSPGVSVSVVDESFYASATAGTVPLVVIATASNKFQPGSTTALATGTVPSNAGKLYLVTSQRDVLQTFGNPNYYTAGGTPQYGNELNEHGLYALYEFLGIANTAYVIRADADLAQLAPRTVQPAGTVTDGTYWLDTSMSTYGIFRSNGSVNSALAWGSHAPKVITSGLNLETVVQGNSAMTASVITSGTAAVISATGSLVINGIVIPVTTSDSLTSIVSKINGNNKLSMKNISATIFSRVGKFSPTATAYGDIYNLRIVAASNSTVIDLLNTTSSVLTDLGFSSAEPYNSVLPASSFGNPGDFAIDVVNTDPGDVNQQNRIWEKITLNTTLGTQAWWFRVGSTDTSYGDNRYAGWGWREAVARVITGSVSNPVFNTTDSFTIKVGSSAPVTVIVPPTTSLNALVAAINTQLNSSGGTNAVASVYSTGSNNYLRITNFDSDNVYLKDNDNQSQTHHPLRTAGILATQTYFGSAAGIVSNPTFNAATLLTTSAVPANTGSGYAVNDLLTVSGGTHATSTVLNVTSIQAVAYATTGNGATGGIGFAVNDTLTFSGANYLTPVIMVVQAISGGTITQMAIIQAGQYIGPTPSNPVTPSATSGNGSGAAINIDWGVASVSVSTAGNYSTYPTNPVIVTGGTAGAAGAAFNLTPGYLTSDVFTIDAGGGPVTIHVPASPNNTLSGVINEINNSFASGPIAATAVNNKLFITNTNGTNFTMQDVSGTPLYSAGIDVGVTYGRQLTYQGYSPSLTVPSSVATLASGSVWINTTPSDRGANYVLKQYQGGNWIVLNSLPNTGSVPMYSSDAAANGGFGAAKSISSVYLRYNSEDTAPASAAQQFLVWDGTAWSPFAYTASNIAPLGPPAAGTFWYNTNLVADVMVSNGQVWKGYRNVYPATDPNGIIISATAPTVHSDLTPLVDYDLWLDSNDTANYPKLYRYIASTKTWQLISNTDHSSPAGIIFADARPNNDGTASGISTTAAMATSDYVDSDAPNAELYPAGLLLFNTRYSTNNVKVWTPGYLPSGAYTDRWVTASGNRSDGTPYMGYHAQRAIVVKALQSAIENSQEARAETTSFTLLTVPGYPELLDDMITMNTDKKNTAFIIGDTPARLSANGTSIQNWATNSAGASMDGETGLISHSPYASLYYPWALATNLDGSEIFVPPSVLALRTYAYNDQVAYPWFAPAGFNRGLVTGATSVGYLDANNNDTYVPVVLNQSQRDVLYTNSINPIAYIPNRGLVIYGQKTLNPVSNALDRVNVARLVNYLVVNLDNLAKPFLFEPNDKQTRDAVTNTFQSFMNSLVGLRALYDFAVVCDETNNTTDRIDRNELWIDVAIKPEKAIEFIYIPLRILNTGTPLPGANRVV